MKNKKIIHKITQGMYVLTTRDGGCIVDAVSQISSKDNPLISVAVMKENNTNKLLKENNYFALSILSKNTNPEIITTFGMNSMRNINKFENIKTEEINGLNIITDSLGYLFCEITDMIENDTHTLFIGKLIEADVFKDEEEMSYKYYQENKTKFLKKSTKKGQTSWICSVCGYIHYAEELPDDFECPICHVDKSMFQKQN